MITIYKGYLKGNGKHAATSFKDGGKLLSYNTVRVEESYVGILEDDFIMVDVDDIDDAETLLGIVEDKNIQCSVLETTGGMHFYFKGYDITANKIKWWTNIGIVADYKLGIKNTADPLKINGQTRKWIRKVKDHDALPKWLYPMSRDNGEKNPGLKGSSAGDGRNDKLFTYILKLQRQGLSKAEIKETISIINKYILDDPVPDSELRVILRDEAFMKQSFYKDSKFLHDLFGDFLISEYHICKIANVLHIYKDGYYSDQQEDIEAAMLQNIKSLTQRHRKEVLAYLQLQAKERGLSSTNYIVLKNGIYNLESKKLEDFSPEIVVKNKIPVAYIKDSYYEVTDKTLNKIAVNDKKIRAILEEILGYILFRKNSFAATFILTGDGSNGKSSFLKIILQLVGESNKASLDLNELDQRFKTAELFGKLVNIGDDISKGYIKESSVFKKLSTGETLNVERKGKDPFDFTNYAKLIFSANEMPKIDDFTDGLGRRLRIIPFKAKFKENDEDYDPFITEKLLSEESLHYVLNLALNGLERLLKNNGFTKSQVVEKETEAYQVENNPILAFLSEEDPKIENEPAANVYQQYLIFCAENSFKPVTNIQFSKQIKRLRKVETKVQWIENKSVRIYKSIKE